MQVDTKTLEDAISTPASGEQDFAIAGARGWKMFHGSEDERRTTSSSR